VNKSPKVSFHTLGCRLNQSETALMMESFRQKGYQIVEHGRPADVSVINTCSVTERADARCRQEIRKVRKCAPTALICAVGCYAQADPQKVQSIEGIDFVVGTDKKYRLVDLIQKHKQKTAQSPLVLVSNRPDTSDFDYPIAGYYPTNTRANIKIQDGCNFACSFCLIPRIRGLPHSRRLGDIMAEGYELVRRGHKELVITGVNIGLYRFEDKNIGHVAKALSQIPELERIRISSIEPSTIPTELIQWMSTSPKACQHLHIPLQSGDDKILSRMKRIYTTQQYSDFIHRVTRMMPLMGLGTDVIVGFPGETDASFKNTYEFVRSLPFTYLHVFTYSDRDKTLAKNYPDKVHSSIVKQRVQKMLTLGRQKRKTFYKKFLKQKMSVLFETVDGDGMRKGFTHNYIRVGTNPNQAQENRIHQVILSDAKDEFCTAG